MEVTKTTVMENQTSDTAATPQGEGDAGSMADQQNTFQKFLASLFSGGKEDAKGINAAPSETAAVPQEEGAAVLADGSGASQRLAKTYTGDDINAIIEAEKQKWEQQSKEQERLQKLPPQERAQAESEAKENELSKLRAELLQRDLKDAAQSKLGKEGYPVGLAGLLNYTDQASMEQSLAHTQEIFKAALQTAIKEKLRGRTPQGLAGASNTGSAIRDEISRNIKGGFN